MKHAHDTPRTQQVLVDGSMRRATAGFTLVEMLAATIVLALLTGMVAMGVAVGMRAYQASTFESESQILSSTIDTALSGPLRSMTYTSAVDGTRTYTVVYRNDAAEKVISPQLTVVDGELYLQGANTTGDGIPLLNGSAYSDCTIIDSKLNLPIATDSQVAVSGSYTIQSTVNSSLEKECTFSFVLLSSDSISKSTT